MLSFFSTFYYHSNLNANFNRPFFSAGRCFWLSVRTRIQILFFSLSFSSFSTNCCPASPWAGVDAGLLIRWTQCKTVGGWSTRRKRRVQMLLTARKKKVSTIIFEGSFYRAEPVKIRAPIIFNTLRKKKKKLLCSKLFKCSASLSWRSVQTEDPRTNLSSSSSLPLFLPWMDGWIVNL